MSLPEAGSVAGEGQGGGLPRPPFMVDLGFMAVPIRNAHCSGGERWCDTRLSKSQPWTCGAAFILA